MSQQNIAKFNPISKIWTGPTGKYPFSMDIYIGDLLLEAFDKNPEKIVQINHDEETVWTAKELKLASIRVAQNLIKLGIKSNDVIGFDVRNSEKVYPLVLGCMLMGAVVNPLHISFTKTSIGQMFAKTKPKIVVCDFDVYEIMRHALMEIDCDAKIFTLLETVPNVPFIDELLMPTGNEENFLPIKFDEPADEKKAAIICTSGTTGEPKGVNCVHTRYLSRHTMITQTSPDVTRSFNFTPIYWGSGTSGLVSAVLGLGETRISTKNQFSVETLMEIVEKYKPTLLALPPTQLTIFLNSPKSKICDFSSVKTIICFGSIVPPELRENFKKTFPTIFLSTFYGTTECACSFAFPGDSYDGLTVGKIAANIQLKIVDDNGNKLGFYEEGEIRLKSEFGFAGYFNDPQATIDALDDEGFLKTGDIGYFDENASLFVTDRMKEVFKHNAFHISPTELENFISKIGGVEFVAVVGVPDPIATELPAAVIQKRAGFDELTAEDISNAVADNFPPQKNLVGGVYFVDEMPLTPSGKIKKKLAREIAMIQHKQLKFVG